MPISPMKPINIYDAKTRLSQLVNKAASGEEAVSSNFRFARFMPQGLRNFPPYTTTLSTACLLHKAPRSRFAS